MNREEAISVLEESKRQNEIMRDNPNTFFKVSDIVTGEKNAQKRIDALNMAISALRQQEQQPNDPLTLDELREMGGEPVWIVEDPDWGHWELSADAEDYVTDREPSFYGMKHNDPAGRYGLHKLGWLAYRQKPEEG